MHRETKNCVTHFIVIFAILWQSGTELNSVSKACLYIKISLLIRDNSCKYQHLQVSVYDL